MAAVTAGTSPAGSAVTIPRQIVRAIRATSAEAMAEVTGVAEAIDAAHPAERPRHFDLTQSSFLDSFQCESGVSLESLEKAVFPFASRCGLKYR